MKILRRRGAQVTTEQVPIGWVEEAPDRRWIAYDADGKPIVDTFSQEEAEMAVRKKAGKDPYTLTPRYPIYSESGGGYVTYERTPIGAS